MPSEADSVERALEGLAGPADAFHSVLAEASEDIRGFLSRHRSPDRDPTEAVASELGAFGSGRIDPQRFSSLLSVPESVSADDLRRVERAHAILKALEARGGKLLTVQLPPGGDLRSAVDKALADAGKAFGVMRAIAPAVEGSGPADDPEAYADGFPFRLWSKAERALAPPVVVYLKGEDLVAGGLAEFLDGGVKIVLVVEGPTPPAALARLISPRVLTAQGSDEKLAGRLAQFEGPVIAAIGAGGLVPFVHDPRSGSTYAERLSLNGAKPDEQTLVQLGSQTPFQQNEDLQHLRALAAAPTAVPMAAPAAGSAAGSASGSASGVSMAEQAAAPAAAAPDSAPTTDPVDRLAGWLLQQADLGSAE